MRGIPIGGKDIDTASVEALFEHDERGANSLQYAISRMNVHDALKIVRKEGVTKQFLLQGDFQGDNSLDYAVAKLGYEVDKDAKNLQVNSDAEKMVMAIGRITGIEAFNKYMPGEFRHKPEVVKIAGKLRKETIGTNMSVIQGVDKPDIDGAMQAGIPLKKSGRGHLRLVD